MKTTRLFAAAALLPLLFSCAKEEIKTNDTLNGDGQKYDFTITVSGSEDSITKASLSDTEGLFWVPGGKAGIVKKDGENTVKYESNALSNIYEYKGYNQASFAFTDTYAGEYKFFYPYHSEATLDKIPFWVSPKQTTNAGSSSDCFALVSNDMVSLSAEKHDIAAETTYKVVGSYIRFTVFGKADELLKSIIIKGADRTVSGRYFVNGNDNSLVSGVDYNAETIVLKVDGDYSVPADRANAVGLYTSVLPGMSQNTYTVITDKGFYKFTSESAKPFNFNTIKDLPLNLGSIKAVKTTPDALYVVGDATTAGWNANDAIALTKVAGENKYQIKNIPLIPGGEGFKFLLYQGDWSNALVNAGNDTFVYYVDVPDGKDLKFTVDKAGYYDLVVDFDAFTVTTTYKSELLKVLSNHKKDSKLMFPTGNDGEFKASGVFIDKIYDNKSEEENKNAHDFFILVGESEAYNVGGNFTGISSFDANSDYTYTADVTKNASKDNGWWINEGNNQTKRLYDITLNTKTNKVSVRFTQGKSYWLVGDPFAGWTGDDKYKSTADGNGIVTWEVETTKTGEWKICGENTSDDFWSGEWYYSTGTPFEWSWDGGNNYTTESNNQNGFDVNVFCGDQKWKFNETGTFTITFDTKNLTIKVVKK